MSRQWDHYCFKDSIPLGKGAYGTVSSAIFYPDKNNKLQCYEVAVKKMPINHDKELNISVIYECSACVAVSKSLRSSTNVIKYRDFFINNEEQEIWITMEVAHSTLKQIINKALLCIDGDSWRSWSKLALELFLQACKGCLELHSIGYAHLDIKPGNFLVKHVDKGVQGAVIPDAAMDRHGFFDGRAAIVKVSDLGMAMPEFVNPMNYHHHVGTICYNSPEVNLQLRNYDGRADVFSMGCILYELLTLRTCFPMHFYSKMIGMGGTDPSCCPLVYYHVYVDRLGMGGGNGIWTEDFVVDCCKKAGRDVDTALAEFRAIASHMSGFAYFMNDAMHVIRSAEGSMPEGVASYIKLPLRIDMLNHGIPEDLIHLISWMLCPVPSVRPDMDRVVHFISHYLNTQG